MLAAQHRITTLGGDSWSADIKKRIVNYNYNDVTELPDRQTVALLLHEIAHIHYTTNWETKDEKHKELEICTMDALEDMAVEYLISQDYTNAKEVLTETMKEVHDKLRKNLHTIPITRFEKAVTFAQLELTKPNFMQVKEPYEKAGVEVAKYIKENRKQIEERKNTIDLLLPTQDIIQIILKHLGEATDQEKQQMAQNQQGAGQGRTPSEEEQQQKPFWEKDNDSTKNAMNDIISDLLKGGNGNLSQRKAYILTDPITSITDQARTIGQRLANILKANNTTKYNGRYRSGKLPAKRLIKIRTSNDQRPFVKKIEQKNKSYAFVICTDVSGSMYENDDGGKEENHKSPLNWALSSAYMTAEALRIAKVKRKLLMFGTTASVIRKDEEEIIRWTDVSDRKYRDMINGTYYPEALIQGLGQLRKMKAERKILLMLTDGSEKVTPELTNICQKAKKEGIELIGITMEKNNMIRQTFAPTNGDEPILSTLFGKNNNIVIDPEELDDTGTVFINILNKTITKYL